MRWFGTTPDSPAPRRSPAEKLRARHAQAFAQAGVEPVTVRYAPSDEVSTDYEVHLVRDNGGLTFLYNPRNFRRHRAQHMDIAPAYIYWFAQTDPSVERISCDLSDGQWPGLARFTFSTCFAGKVLLPDLHFFIYHGYAEADRVAATAPAWDDRGETVFWRGKNNNEGVFSLEPAHIDAPWAMQRARLALMAREIDGLDARFVADRYQRQGAQLEAAGLTGPQRNWQDWAGDKYALDIDGYTNAWSNLMQRLRLGCCVLKVESQHGFRQWYYDKLVPYQTYVPVRADMSDLAEQIDWVRSHDNEAREIAANGQAFARKMTFEAETAVAAGIIERNWR